MTFRRLNLSYLDEAFSIILDAIALLSHISKQWQQGYPSKQTMKEDIDNGNLYGCFEEETLIGVFALVKGFNPDYVKIEGKWEKETGDHDMTIHRVAVKEGYHNRHVGDAIMSFAIDKAKEEGILSFKADTHRSNLAMQKLCRNAHMEYKGVIYLVRDEEDNARLAYEIIL